jgi:hypothetical protein
VATAFIGLAGALFGAVTALVGAALSDRRQRRSEEMRWRRDQMGTAYETTLRYLLRAANRRSEVNPQVGRGVLHREHMREWYDDLVEGHCWLLILISRCGPSQATHLREAFDLLDRQIQGLSEGAAEPVTPSAIWNSLRATAQVVSDCARLDMAG